MASENVPEPVARLAQETEARLRSAEDTMMRAAVILREGGQRLRHRHEAQRALDKPDFLPYIIALQDPPGDLAEQQRNS